MDVRQSPFLLEIRDVTRRYTLPRESLFKPPAEVQALRGQIEELQQQLEQAKQGQRSQYLDLDGRLNRLEGGAPASASSSASRR